MVGKREKLRANSLLKKIAPRPQGGFLLWNIGAVSKNIKGVVASIKPN
jgi:hypothetical protein